MFKAKKETYTIKEFMAKGKAVEVTDFDEVVHNISRKEAVHYGMFGGAFTGLLASTNVTQAQGEAVTVVANTGDLYGRIVNAFDPLIDLIQALVYPVAMVVVLGGALYIMIGNKEKGFGMMQGAGLGYVLVQLTPMVLNILVGAMKGM